MPLIIAEAGVNHDGEREKAIALVDAAHGSGADIVKFQMFEADLLTTIDAPKAAYQQRGTPESSSQREMLRRLELSRDDLVAIAEHCEHRGIEFLCTAFDIQNLAFLVEELHMRRVKIPSGDITDAPGLFAAARYGTPLIVSTGMANLDEIRSALAIIASARPATASESVTLLHCVTAYPAPIEDMNLRAMTSLRMEFGLEIGLSDHSETTSLPVAATALGASVIEKHLTLDRSAAGPDHAASLEPADFARMVKEIREVERALGDGLKRRTASEEPNVVVARRSLVATVPIANGDVLTTANLGTRRPGSGISAMEYSSYLGRRAARDYAAGEQIDQ